MEAGFSETIKLVNADGAERMLTFRGEKAEDWKAVESTMRECVAEAQKTGWAMPVLKKAPTTQSATTQPAPTTTPAPQSNSQVVTNGNTFHATKLKIAFSEDGKKKGKMYGGKFEKFGVTLWPEIATTLGFDIDQMSAGEYQIDMVVAYAMNDKGQPSKITGRAV